MKKLDAISVYSMYTALKLHFTTDYDYVKYNGKIRKISPETFDKKRSKYLFYKLSNKYPAEELESFLISNLNKNPGMFVTDVFNDNAISNYREYKKFCSAPVEYFIDDIEKLFLPTKTPLENFECFDKYTCPRVLSEMVGERFSKYSFAVLLDVLPVDYVAYLDKQDIHIWKEVRKNVLDIRPFLKYDTNKAKREFKETTEKYK